MTRQEYQQWLNDHGASLKIDGQIGDKTRAATIAAFTNPSASKVSLPEIATYAGRVGISPKQMAAIGKVESSGSGFSHDGRVKILFERHKFWRMTDGQFPVSAFNDPKAGGYGVDSWSKLLAAISLDPYAAFCACSWGAFQIMGFHWQALGYPTPLEMPWQMSRGEAAHYDALCRFIRVNGLVDEAAKISRDPETNRGFAKAYNGAGYETFGYHLKLAEAMR